MLHGIIVKVRKEAESAERRGCMISTEQRTNFCPGMQPEKSDETLKDIPVRILVVDDVEANLELFRLFLAREKAQVALASGGQQALEEYDFRRPDCLFLDLRMPGMDGIEVAMEIRRREAQGGKKAFIAGMSGGDAETDRMCCEAAGMDCFLPKPVTARQIQKVLQQCFKGDRKPLCAKEKPEDFKVSETFLSGIHLGSMLELLRGNWDLMKMAVENRFLPQIHKDLQDLQNFIQKGDLSQAERVAHKMKGNLGYFGKNSAFLLAEKVRFSCERGDLRDAEHYMPAFVRRCSLLEDLFTGSHWEQKFSSEGEYRGNFRG